MPDNVCEQPVFHQLFREIAPQLRNFLYYRCGNEERANDLVQDAFLILWEKCKDILPNAAKSFLFTVSKNLMLNLIKKDKVRFDFAKTEETEKLEYENPEYKMEYKEFKNELETAINNLSEGQKEVFLMNRIDKLTYREIAERLGVSQKAVEKRMHKALLKLKKLLDGH